MSEETILRPEQNYGPGNVLRAKREEYEWSIDAVAEALHLSTSSVKAIEADRYEDLPGATYVMGYWRSYARLLGIDIEDTIEANKQNLNIVTAEASGMDVHRAFNHRKKGGSGGWLLFLIAAAVFAYFAWQPPQLFGLLEKMNVDESIEAIEPIEPIEPVEAPNDPESVSPKTTRPVEKQQVLRSIEKPVSPAQSVTAKTLETDNANLLESQAVAPESSSGLVMLTPTPTRSDNNTDSQTNFLAEPAPGSVLVSDASQVQVAETASTIVPVELTTVQSGEASAPAAVASGAETATVTFKLVKDTWLDVRDHSRKRLYYKTGKAGAEIDVTGIPPFYVLIQPPDGATVHYQGKNQPFEPHENGLFARFKLSDTLESL